LINVRYDADIAATQLLGTRPTQGTFGVHGAEIVAASDRCRSVLFYRMAKLGRGRMPHLGSSLVDEAGLTLMGDWIDSLKPAAATAENSAIAPRERRRQLLAELSANGHTPGERQPLIDQLLSSTSGALLLVSAIDKATLRAEVRDDAVRAGAAHADVQVRDLFERFVPEAQRVQRLGNVIKPEQLLSIAGDATPNEAVKRFSTRRELRAETATASATRESRWDRSLPKSARRTTVRRSSKACWSPRR
jgi:hypothetical protein